MIIRSVSLEDADAIIEMGARMHLESAYAFLPFEGEKIRQLLDSFMADTETQCGLVAEENNRLVAMFGGYLADYFFCHEKLACDLVLFVDEAYRGGSAAPRLLRAFRDWARQRGAREICLGTSTRINTARTGKFYERMGLSHVGGIYKQRLS